MTDIKLPVKWLQEKGIKICVGDCWTHNWACDIVNGNVISGSDSVNFNCVPYEDIFITSFADRENTGEQPVEDWVPVETLDIVDYKDDTRTASEIDWVRPNDGDVKHGYICSWKPNAEALMEIYTAEQNNSNSDYSYDSYDLTRVAEAITEWAFKDGFRVKSVASAPLGYLVGKEGFTQEQWQDKRYELGLDKKETKLKLTEDDIGKKFENKARAVFEVTGVGIFSASLKSKETGWESVWTCELDGAIHTGGMYKDNKLIKRHEPRYWLKDLPDADLFTYDWIACDSDGTWFYYMSEPRSNDVNHVEKGSASEQSGHLDCLQMPRLKNDEWKLSKISMVELKEWQEANK